MFFKRLFLLTAAAVLLIASPAVSELSVASAKSLEMTIYNNNRAFIKDTREIFLPPGESQLRFTGISSNIIPDSVYLLAGENNIDILSQNYSPGIVNKKFLLDSFVGKEIKVVSYDSNNNPSRTVKARLLSNNDGPVYEIDGEIYLDYPGRPVLPELPGGIAKKPQISWKLNTPESFDGPLTAFYMTGGINWKARYNIIIDTDGQQAVIDALISINNRSGAAYKDVSVKLIAGKVNVSPELMPMRAMETRMDYAAAPAREKIGGYHQYSLQHPVSLENNFKKELTLFSSGEVPVKREYVTRSMGTYYRTDRTGVGLRQDVDMYTVFKNSKELNLGMPLPAGTVRVFEPDSDGALQFVGEEDIVHTPAEEEIRVKTGSAFDIVCRRKQISYKKLYNNTYETEWEITLSSSEEEQIDVQIIENLDWSWEILESSHKYEQISAGSVKFNIPLKPGAQEKITYKVRISR